MNYYNFIKQIKNISLSNGLVNETGEGDIYQHLNSGMHKYPCVFLTVQNVTFANDIVNVNATLFYVDRLLDNSSNKLEIQSNGITVLSQILDRIAEETVINTVQNVYTLFEEKFADLCAGQFVTFRASFPNDVICSDDEFEVKTITLNHNGIYEIIGYDKAVVAVEGGVWGQITGNINAQTDLMALINSKQNNLTAGTNIKIEGDVISNTYEYDDSGIKSDIENIEKLIPAQATEQNKLADKDFVNSTVATNAANFRGNWTDWGSVPTAASGYPVDYVGNRTPTNNDYLVVQDASDYSETGKDITIVQLPFVNGSARIRIEIDGFSWTLNHTTTMSTPQILGQSGERIKVTYTPPFWIISGVDIPLIVDGVSHPVGTDAYKFWYNNSSREYVQKVINYAYGSNYYNGSWRFIYVGDWSIRGKDGWKPQYKIGSAFTAAQQAAIDSNITAAKVAEIDEKQNILTAGNGITIINDVISSDIDKLNISGTNTIQPNKFYVITNINTAITINKGTDVQNKMNLYAVRFNLISGGSITFSGFGTIKWNGKGTTTPTWEVGKTYEVSIEDGFAFYGEF